MPKTEITVKIYTILYTKFIFMSVIDMKTILYETNFVNIRFLMSSIIT